MENIMITIPDKIYFLKTIPDNISNSKYNEFSIYYENIIYPYSEVYDIEVISKHGNDYKRFWRISNYYDNEPFDVTFKVYAPYGKLLAEKSVTMIPVDFHFSKPFNILCIGDSMTKGAMYMEHINNKLYNVNFKGIRSFNGHLFHEGRGGWRIDSYFKSIENDPSPILFPIGFDNYYGNMDFYNLNKNFKDDMYYHSGYHHLRDIRENECYYSQGKLYSYDRKELSDDVKWEFSFKKYMERYDIGDLDAVSLLFGANDLQITKYEDTEEHVNLYVNNMNVFINSIREYNPNLKIIINMPIPGADQNAWGFRSCLGSGKRYNYNMMKLGEAIIENYKNDKNIEICPMAICIDTKSGFASTDVKTSNYSIETEKFQNNWVHPQESGYRQMGDALAAIIEKLRN